VTWFAELWGFLEAEIFPLPSLQHAKGGLFNFYRDQDPAVEIAGAAARRRQNLWNFLANLPQRPALLLVGEAPGWRGCRFSGVPFTSEAQLEAGGLGFGGARTSLSANPHRETSAGVFWDALAPHYPGFFAWNCVPFHPHTLEGLCSNRRPTKAELRQFSASLARLIDALQPQRALAIGRVAQQTLAGMGLAAYPLRHPAHGGAAEFRAGLQRFFAGEGSVRG
jgi:uracil-DNA glycosylase